jgi:hypothetical protein
LILSQKPLTKGQNKEATMTKEKIKTGEQELKEQGFIRVQEKDYKSLFLIYVFLGFFILWMIFEMLYLKEPFSSIWPSCILVVIPIILGFWKLKFYFCFRSQLKKWIRDESIENFMVLCPGEYGFVPYAAKNDFFTFKHLSGFLEKHKVIFIKPLPTGDIYQWNDFIDYESGCLENLKKEKIVIHIKEHEKALKEKREYINDMSVLKTARDALEKSKGIISYLVLY